MTLERALAAMRRGDAAGLRGELDRDPALVTARFETTEAPYDGYFHGATLLHHTSGNPELLPLPAEVVEMARELLERGAEVDALSGAGPRQPMPWWRWTTLGLVASSSVATDRGVAAELIELLLAAGADLDECEGRPLYAAVCHADARNGLWDLARLLIDRGAPVDLGMAAAAAGGDAVRSFLGARDGRQRFRHGDDRVGSWQEALDEAAMWASAFDRTGNLGLLLDAGASVSSQVSLHGSPIGPLHRAAVCGAAGAAALLIERGADPTAGDGTHGEPPWKWAEWNGFHELSASLRPGP